MSKLSTWFNNVGEMWKAVVLIVGIFSVGLTAGAAASGMLYIPDRIVSLEQRADSLTDQLSDIRRDVAELRRSNNIQLCLQIAERRHTDWRECLK